MDLGGRRQWCSATAVRACRRNLSSAFSRPREKGRASWACPSWGGHRARGGRDLGAWLGHGDGVASRGAWQVRATPGVPVWGETGGAGVVSAKGTTRGAARWPASVYGRRP